MNSEASSFRSLLVKNGPHLLEAYLHIVFILNFMPCIKSRTTWDFRVLNTNPGCRVTFPDDRFQLRFSSSFIVRQACVHCCGWIRVFYSTYTRVLKRPSRSAERCGGGGGKQGDYSQTIALREVHSTNRPPTRNMIFGRQLMKEDNVDRSSSAFAHMGKEYSGRATLAFAYICIQTSHSTYSLLYYFSTIMTL